MGTTVDHQAYFLWPSKSLHPLWSVAAGESHSHSDPVNWLLVSEGEDFTHVRDGRIFTFNMWYWYEELVVFLLRYSGLLSPPRPPTPFFGKGSLNCTLKISKFRSCHYQTWRVVWYSEYLYMCCAGCDRGCPKWSKSGQVYTGQDHSGTLAAYLW